MLLANLVNNVAADADTDAPVPNVDGVDVVAVADVSRCNCCSAAVADAVVSG